jgi:nitrite reductase/ring-hydroxylating ferredoxin subunit
VGLWEVADGNRIQEGGMGGFMVNGKKILLAKYKGQYYAINALCPHMGGDLCEGRLEGKNVICPRHGHKIDISSGDHAGSFNLPFLKSSSHKGKSYRVIMEGGKVKIEL